MFQPSRHPQRTHPNPDATDPLAGPAISGAGMPPVEAAPPPRPALLRVMPGLNADGSLRTGKLAGLSMTMAIVTLSWPILAESFLQSLVGLTDTFLAAHISEAATDAIGGASYILWFVGLVAMAISVGATALVSRAVGGSRMAVAHAATGQTMILAVVAGIATGALVASVAGPMSTVMNMTGEAAQGFRVYIRICAVGVPALSILAAGIACARGAGDSLRPLLAMTVVNIVNMAFAWALSGVDLSSTRLVGGEWVRTTILENPFSLDLGIEGIAWGTVIGEYVGALMVVLFLIRGSSVVRLKRSRLRPHWHTMRRLVAVGLPNFFETLGMWAGNFLIILMVGWLTVTAGGSLAPDGSASTGGLMGAHIVAIRIEAFSFLPGFAMGAAAATLAGQYLGAGSPISARRAVKRCTLVTVALMGAAGIAFVLVPRFIVSLISGQPTHLEQVPTLIFITGLVQIPFGIGIVLRSALRGAGDAKVVMWLTWISTYLVRLPLAYACSGVDIPLPQWLGGGVLDNPFHDSPSLWMLWVGLCGEIVIRAFLFGGRYLHGGWLKVRV